MRRITDYLLTDHERLSALLVAATSGHVFDRDSFAAFRAGLVRHIAIEEKVLFPAARRARGGEPLSRAHALRIEHAALTSLLVPSPDAALCAEIASILHPHDAVEEGPDGVYAECESLISDAESAALLATARDFPVVPTSAHFDGPTVHRTAVSALTSAARISRPQGTKEAP
jgi:hypothetical protein